MNAPRPFPLACLLVPALLLAVPPLARAQEASKATTASSATPKSIAEATKGWEKRDGFLPLYLDRAGRVYLEVPRPGEEMIYVPSITAGVGANALGLDRGNVGGSRIVRFERAGGSRLLLVAPNLNYRTRSTDPDERRAVEESFARSVLAGFAVVAEDAGRGAVLVDVTDFALQDPARSAGDLGPGYAVDPARSAVYPAGTRAFPRNTEIEVLLTFKGQPGADSPLRGGVAPSPDAVTFRQRLSFVALPEPGYVPRSGDDPRAGYFGVAYADFGVPLGEPLTRRLLSRHRLAKRDPKAALSEPVKPITYYLDRGAPEPMRTALLEGARWWNQAFEAAGFKDAFRVELLPEGADPLDVRYNVIQWVPRDTRGWSYGQSVVDPRTGEILKGHVILDALRARYDYLLAEGLLAPYGSDGKAPPALEAMVLARLRQLSAHEVGHTLGLAHNYLASAQGQASVMDYPHPVVTLTPDGAPDLSAAYATGIGAWDKVAIRYGYAEFPAGEEAKALAAIVGDARAAGLTFLTDQDARSPGGTAHPETSLWDNGADAAAELRRAMAVRKAALARFGERAIRPGAPLATLEEALVPLYLHHRYQAQAAAKAVGGERYAYALRGDGQVPVTPVPPAEQEAALAALLETLEPGALALPPALIAAIPPRPAGYGATPELFSRTTGVAFDVLAPPAAAADLTLGLLLQPERAARLVQQNALDPSLPGFEALSARLVAAVFGARSADPYHAAIRRRVQRLLAERLMDLVRSAPEPHVRAVSLLRLADLQGALAAGAAGATPPPPGTPESPERAAERAHGYLLAYDLRRFLERRDDGTATSPPRPTRIPPGDPLGGD